MNPIDELLAEHDAVKTTLKILKCIGQDVAKSAKIANPEHLDQLFDSHRPQSARFCTKIGR